MNRSCNCSTDLSQTFIKELARQWKSILAGVGSCIFCIICILAVTFTVSKIDALMFKNNLTYSVQLTHFIAPIDDFVTNLAL